MENIIKKYSNGEITIIWKPNLCVHATICFRELPEVFKPYHRPWVDPHGADTQKIIEIVNRCPTQALSFEWNENQSAEIPEQNSDNDTELTPMDIKPACEVSLLEGGPILIKGNFVLRNQNGSVLQTASVVTLCRCGLSKNSPFCDGSHNFK